MQERINILIIEDNQSDYELLLRSLKKHELEAEYFRAQNENEMRHILESERIDVIISDYILPGFTGIEALKIFKEYQLMIPFITLTGTGTEVIAVEMMKEGSDDYVLKEHIERVYHSIIIQSEKYKTFREKKALDLAVLESEKAYRLLAENTSDVISLHNLSGDFKYASPAIFELSGYKPDEVIGKKLNYFFHNDDVANMRHQLESLVGKDDKLRFEYKFQKKDGSHIWIETTGKIVYDPNTSQAKEIVAVSRDATDRILKDKKLKESEEQYRLIAENATDMITRHDLHSVYNYVSNSSYTLIGYSPDDLIGKRAYEFLHPDDIPRIKTGLNDFINKGLGIYTASYRYKKKDGSYIWIESTNKLTFVEGTDIIEGVISISRDITERKAFEARLEEKIKDLDTFIYRSSHDLKGPLASLQGLLNVAKSEVNDEVAIQYLKLIEKSVMNLDTILMDLLNITKITQGSLSIVELNIKEIILKIISSFENLPEYSSIKWELDFDENELLYLDKSLVKNIFQNLIINAIKYQDKDKDQTVIKISTSCVNNEMVIIIEDNGEGISGNLQKSVFDMFFRGNTKSTGTGLGLYIVKNAVEKSGGRIRLVSKEKIGSIFTIYLPIKPIDDSNAVYLAKNNLI